MKKRAKYPFGIPPFQSPESWGKKSKYYDVSQNDSLVGIKVESSKETFTIPIVDVRNGFSQRERADEMIKQENIQRGSKYFSPSTSLMGYSYNNSMKK